MPTIPPTTIECPSSPTIYYYVEMTSSLAILASDHEQCQLVVNWEDLNPKLNNLSVPSQTEGPPPLVDLLSLPKLLTRRTHHKESLVDYSNSHVVTSNQYLVV
jgi:hypothetical protein